MEIDGVYAVTKPALIGGEGMVLNGFNAGTKMQKTKHLMIFIAATTGFF
jgi:hypothetical protein